MKNKNRSKIEVYFANSVKSQIQKTSKEKGITQAEFVRRATEKELGL